MKNNQLAITFKTQTIKEQRDPRHPHTTYGITTNKVNTDLIQESHPNGYTKYFVQTVPNLLDLLNPFPSYTVLDLFELAHTEEVYEFLRTLDVWEYLEHIGDTHLVQYTKADLLRIWSN